MSLGKRNSLFTVFPNLSRTFFTLNINGKEGVRLAIECDILKYLCEDVDTIWLKPESGGAAYHWGKSVLHL